MVLIYSGSISPRLNYTAGLIFRDLLATEVTITDNPGEFEASSLPKFSYGLQPLGGEPFLEGGHLLFTCSLDLPPLETITCQGETCFFPASGASILPFDPLASVFLAVSRMEEYIPGHRDQHGRFTAPQSFLHHYGLLHKPMVNIWSRMLARQLTDLYPGLSFPGTSFRIEQTIDIDNAWAFLHKGPVRTLAAALKDLVKGNSAQFRQRIAVLMGNTPDPYDTYDYLVAALTPLQHRTRFFFLLGDYGRYDKGIAFNHPKLVELIQRLAKKFPTGIHPSWASSSTPDASQLALEIERLQTILNDRVVASRQHYLRITLPETYRRLIAAGIHEDYSMGYADVVGFRAGIASPFFFYDLNAEAETSLRIFPFAFMDVTLRQYNNLPAAEAMLLVNELLEHVRSVGGYFSAVWHNESLNGRGRWEGYRELFEMLNQVAETVA